LRKTLKKNITPLIDKTEDIKIALIKKRLDIHPNDFSLWVLKECKSTPAQRNIKDLKNA